MIEGLVVLNWRLFNSYPFIITDKKRPKRKKNPRKQQQKINKTKKNKNKQTNKQKTLHVPNC